MKLLRLIDQLVVRSGQNDAAVPICMALNTALAGRLASMPACFLRKLFDNLTYFHQLSGQFKLLINEKVIILYFLSAYAICGIIFSIPFLFSWIKVLDEGVHGTSWVFKVVLLPGTIVFWPVLLRKYLRAKSSSR